MNGYFADTFLFLALLNQKDEHHADAVAIMNRLRDPLVTTPWVLTEVADALSHPSSRTIFVRFLEDFRSDGRALIVSDADQLWERGLRLYADRPDKAWSLTDCISFVVMEQRGIREALTADRHFEQAGFTALMK